MLLNVNWWQVLYETIKGSIEYNPWHYKVKIKTYWYIFFHNTYVFIDLFLGSKTSFPWELIESKDSFLCMLWNETSKQYLVYACITACVYKYGAFKTVPTYSLVCFCFHEKGKIIPPYHSQWHSEQSNPKWYMKMRHKCDPERSKYFTIHAK